MAQIEGHNWRHGDIEDMLATVAFLRGKKWSSMLIKRTYFGNWLRDYSQAIDVGSLKGPINADTIRILVRSRAPLLSPFMMADPTRCGCSPSWPSATPPRNSR